MGFRLCEVAGLVLCLLFSCSCRKAPKKECDYFSPRCATGEVCTHVSAHGLPAKAACVQFLEEEMPVSRLFESDQPFWCSQGSRSESSRSHSFGADVFALDLASVRLKDEVTVFAPASGEAFVFDSCEERDSSPMAKNSSHCGLGYGNHVKIWDGKNLFLVGHLARALITTGPVREGQPIGIEGVSGSAGMRPVHLSVSRIQDGEDVFRILSAPGWKGSTPVRFSLKLETGKAVWNDELECHDDAQQVYRFQPKLNL